MKKLTMGEFREVCNNVHPKEFILHSDNQEFKFGELGMKFDLRFTSIDFCLNPDIIYLMFGKSCLQISKIKQIYKCQSMVCRNKYNIVCTGFNDENSETIHTLILQ